MAQYYTYIYNDVVKNESIYIGKGSVNRAYSHLKKIRDNSHFKNRLSKMKSENNIPDIEIINTTNEFAAFWLEKCFIVAFGRRDIGTGSLLNMTPGGDNPPIGLAKGPHKFTETSKNSLRNSVKLRMLGNKLAISNKGKCKWVNNGVTNKFVDISFNENGWISGRILKRNIETGRII